MNVLITGASAGIGRELAYLHAEQGDHLLLVGRNAEQLFETKHFVEQRGGSAVVLPYDIGQSLQIKALLRATENTPVDILINNAGFGLYGEFIETDLARELNMIDVNIRALTHLTKAFARRMKIQGGGRIIQIASTSSFHGGPLERLLCDKSVRPQFLGSFGRRARPLQHSSDSGLSGSDAYGFRQNGRFSNVRIV